MGNMVKQKPRVCRKPKKRRRVEPKRDIRSESEKYKLPDGVSEWFIFTPRVRKDPNGSRPNRTAGKGYWKASAGDKEVVKIDDKLKGFKKSLVFKKRETPNSKGQKTNWLMNEYTNPGLVPKKRKKMGSADDNMILDEWVLCKVYKKKNSITEENEEPETDSVSSVREVAQDVVSSVREVAQDREQLFDFNAYKKQRTVQHNRAVAFADRNPTIEQQQLHINTTCIERQPQPLFHAYKKQCTEQHNRALTFADQNPTIEQQQLLINTACIEQQPQPLFVDAYKTQCTEQHNKALWAFAENPTIEQQQLHINSACIEQQPQPKPLFDAYKKQWTEQHNRALLAFAENPTIEQHNRALLAFSEEPETDSVSSVREVAQDGEQLFDFNSYKKQRSEQHNRAVAFADQNPTIEQQQLHINTTCIERQPQPLFNAYKKQCTEEHNRALLAFAENPTIEQHNRAILAFSENPTIEQQQVLVNTTENYTTIEQQPQVLANTTENYTTIEQQPQDKQYSEQHCEETFAQFYNEFDIEVYIDCLGSSSSSISYPMKKATPTLFQEMLHYGPIKLRHF